MAFSRMANKAIVFCSLALRSKMKAQADKSMWFVP